MKIKEYKYTIGFQLSIYNYGGGADEFCKWLEIILKQYGELELVDEYCEYDELIRYYKLKSDKIVEIDCSNIARYTVDWMDIKEARILENFDKFVEVKFPSYNKVF